LLDVQLRRHMQTHSKRWLCTRVHVCVRMQTASRPCKRVM
jgi:hypothetical protein